MKKNNSKIDVDTKESELKGIKGFFETILRKFRTPFFFAALIPVYILAAVIMAISVLPGIYLL